MSGYLTLTTRAMGSAVSAGRRKLLHATSGNGRKAEVEPGAVKKLVTETGADVIFSPHTARTLSACASERISFVAPAEKDSETELESGISRDLFL